jgi:zinc/manganese transport system substrate-binding protein
VIAAENQYGNVAEQIGGRYVAVSSIEASPETDPHDYEVSPGVASEISRADLVIQNGLGYDDFMSKLEAASPNKERKVIDVQRLLRLPDNTPNPHLWYAPSTMPKVARAVAAYLAAREPAHEGYFRSRAARFLQSLQPWIRAIARFRAGQRGDPVATTEPVADYLLEALGARNMTPFRFQADIMNGVDPSPQDVALEDHLLRDHKVKALLYNQQVTDPLTEAFIAVAKRAHVPVVGVYETMPRSDTYESWMLAETEALRRAVVDGDSTARL